MRAQTQLRARTAATVGAITLVVSLLGAFGATAVPASADTLNAGQTVAAASGLSGVACPTSTTCVAVGSTQSGTNGLIVPIDNGVPGTAQSDTSTQDLTAIACPSATTCVALGSNSSITAVYSGDGANSPSTSSPVDLTLLAPHQATQTITFTSAPPNPASVGATYTPAATGGTSGNPVTFNSAPGSAGICTLNGGTVDCIGTGSCVIDANQAGDANDLAAQQVEQTVTVSPGAAGTATPPSPQGYFVVGADCGVFAFGDANFLGSLPGAKATPGEAIVAIGS